MNESEMREWDYEWRQVRCPLVGQVWDRVAHRVMDQVWSQMVIILMGQVSEKHHE